MNTPSSPHSVALLLLKALHGRASEPDCDAEALRRDLAALSGALEGIEAGQLNLVTYVRSQKDDPSSPDHLMARRLAACANACLGVATDRLDEGLLRAQLDRSEDMRVYLRAIRDGDLDGSEPEVLELIGDLETEGEGNHHPELEAECEAEPA